MAQDMAIHRAEEHLEGASTRARRYRFEAGFWVVAFSAIVVVALGAAPSPLYGVYQQRDGFSTFTITLIFGANSLGTVLSLFLAGHISDWYGRKRVLLPGVALSAVSATVFLVSHDLPALYLGRILSGLSIGFVAATATAYLTELHMLSRPAASLRRAQLVGASLNVVGFAIGALLSGLLAQYVGGTLTTIYAVLLVAISVAIVALVATPDPRGPMASPPRYRPLRLKIPPGVEAQFVACIVGGFIAFAAAGLFAGLAGTFLVGTLHRSSLALLGTAVFIVFAAGVVVQVVTVTWKIRNVLLFGMACLFIGFGLVVLAAWLPTPSLAVFLIGGAITGLGTGAMLKGSLGTVIAISPPDGRAENVAGVLLAGYIGLSLPVIGIGIALRDVSAKVALLGFAVGVAVLVVAVAPALLRRPNTASAVASSTNS